MPYYVRAFCTNSKVPSVATVMAELETRGVNVRAEADDEAELSSPDWEACWLNYDVEKQPIVVECNQDEGEDSLCQAECAEFIEQLNEMEKSPSRDQCIKHLEFVKFIISCQLLSDIDENGFKANDEFLAYFVRHCGAMIHAEGEGFYDGGKIIVPMD